jgi:signal transduction histidine kinase
MRRENDLGQTFVDICVLYELALAAGGSLDLEADCERFLSVLMARRGFAFASVWLRSDRLPRQPGEESAREPVLRRIWRVPSQRSRHLELELSHPAWRRSREQGAFSVHCAEPDFARFLGEGRPTDGAIAIFPLGDVGLLKVHAPRRSERLDAIELAQIGTVAAKFTTTLEGSLAHAKVVLEIAERERAEREREALREQLHQARKLEAVGRLAGGIAHDFNNLLVAVMGNAELLLDEAPAGSSLREGLEAIVRAAQRAASLTTQLLEFARKEKPKSQEVRVDALIGELRNLLRRTLDPRIEILCEPSAGDLVVVGDSSQLHTALLNLATNARDAMPAGGALRLATRQAPAPQPGELEGAGTAEAWIELEVGDTGCGMRAEVAERAFEPFFTTKPQGQGTGLGLATVFGIVRAHGGLVRLSSEPGQGTAVRMLLPARKARAEAAPPRHAGAGSRLASPGLLLIVDDDEAARATAVAIVRRAGWEVLEARDGIEGLEVARSHVGRLRLVLADLRMPRLDGRAMLKALRPLAPALPALLVTGFAEPDELRELEDLATAGVISKPYSVETLLGAIAPFGAPAAVDARG